MTVLDATLAFRTLRLQSCLRSLPRDRRAGVDWAFLGGQGPNLCHLHSGDRLSQYRNAADVGHMGSRWVEAGILNGDPLPNDPRNFTGILQGNDNCVLNTYNDVYPSLGTIT